MGYFYGKAKSTAESVRGMLTNIVKESLADEKAKFDHELGQSIPIFPAQIDGAEFSGNGVDEVKKIVEEYYHKYNTYYRYKVQEAQAHRRSLFHFGEE